MVLARAGRFGFTLQQIVTALATLLPKVSDTGQFFWRKMNLFVMCRQQGGPIADCFGSSHCGASQRTQCDKYKTDCRPTLAHFSKLAVVDEWRQKETHNGQSRQDDTAEKGVPGIPGRISTFERRKYHSGRGT